MVIYEPLLEKMKAGMKEASNTCDVYNISVLNLIIAASLLSNSLSDWVHICMRAL